MDEQYYKDKIQYLEDKLMIYAKKLGQTKGTLDGLIDLDKPVFVNNKLKELKELIK